MKKKSHIWAYLRQYTSDYTRIKQSHKQERSHTSGARLESQCVGMDDRLHCTRQAHAHRRLGTWAAIDAERAEPNVTKPVCSGVRRATASRFSAI
jgi:hypothetical protein